MNSFRDKIARVPKARTLWALSQFLTGKSALHQVGWFRSIWKEQSIDRAGDPIPWITYSCIYFLEQRVKKNMTVYEYGSGNSTLWWAERCKSVISIEYSKGWYEYVKNTMPKNATVKFYDLEEGYEKAILNEDKEFDIVMIDGRKRVETAKNSINKLKKSGVIVWDNTNRSKYSSGINFLKKNGFKQLDFYGPVPISPKNNVTSIFYREDNALGL